MKRLSLMDEGILYRNARPGFTAECAFLPNVVPLGGEEVLCFYRLGQAFYSVDGRLACLRSGDGGRSWTQEGIVWDPDRDDRAYSYTAPHGTRFSDGSLALIAFRVDFTDSEEPLFNPDTGGVRSHETVLFRSPDQGRSWSSPELLAAPHGGTANPPSQIIELNDGRWWLAWERWKAWGDTGPLHIKGSYTTSDDQGRTWSEPVDFPSAADHRTMYSHSRYARMLDGRITALQWAQEVGTVADLDLHFTISDETGTRWSEPHPTGVMGQTSWVADLGEGVLAAAYTSREGMNPGIMVVLSEDEGRTWDVEHQVQVWDAVGQEFLGVVHRPSYPSSHDNIAYGKPHLVALPGGPLVCSWWCTQASVTHARFARLGVE